MAALFQGATRGLPSSESLIAGRRRKKERAEDREERAVARTFARDKETRANIAARDAAELAWIRSQQEAKRGRGFKRDQAKLNRESAKAIAGASRASAEKVARTRSGPAHRRGAFLEQQERNRVLAATKEDMLSKAKDILEERRKNYPGPLKAPAVTTNEITQLAEEMARKYIAENPTVPVGPPDRGLTAAANRSADVEKRAAVARKHRVIADWVAGANRRMAAKNRADQEAAMMPGEAKLTPLANSLGARMAQFIGPKNPTEQEIQNMAVEYMSFLPLENRDLERAIEEIRVLTSDQGL